MLTKLKDNIISLHITIICLMIIGTPLLAPYQLNAKSLSVGSERDMGDKMQSLIRKEFKLIDYPDVAQYVNDLGHKVLNVAGSQYFNYQFYVINDNDFNAFAAPSGLIFFYSGLIIAMDNEDEFLGVIAHEIAHVTNRHLSGRMNKASKINIGTAALILAGIALGASGEGDLSGAVVSGAMATNVSMNLKFSRENEEEADRLSFGWLVKMKRPPEALLSMLSKMRKISIMKMGNPPQYLLTHPDPTQRMGYVRDLLNNYNPGLPSPPENDFNFQRIRYKIIATSKDSQTIIPRLENKIAQGDDSELFFKLGLSQIYIEEGNHSKAREYLYELIDKYPQQYILKSDIGYTYLIEGQTEKALALFLESLEVNPKCAFTIFNLAQTLDQTNQTDQAIKYYEDLLIITPSFTKTHYYLGKAFSKIERPGLSHYHSGIYSWFEGNTKNARYHLAKALQRLPEDSTYKNKCKEMLDKISKLEKI